MKDFWFFCGITLYILSFVGLFIGFALIFLNMISAASWTFSAAALAIIVSAVILKLCEIYDYDIDYSENSNNNIIRDNDNSKESAIILKETHCASCGAPLKDDVCSYCGTRSVIYKRIKPNYLIDNTEAINYIV